MRDIDYHANMFLSISLSLRQIGACAVAVKFDVSLKPPFP